MTNIKSKQITILRSVNDAVAQAKREHETAAWDWGRNLIETIIPDYLNDAKVTLALEQTFVAGACCALAAQDGGAVYRLAYREMLGATRAAFEAQCAEEIVQAAGERRRGLLARLRARVAQMEDAEVEG
jgi:hypothetical protein